jgi:hypothetical protein
MMCHPDRSEAEWRDLLFQLFASDLNLKQLCRELWIQDLEKAFCFSIFSCANKVQTIEDSPYRPSYPVNGAATGVSSNRGRSKSSIARHPPSAFRQ